MVFSARARYAAVCSLRRQAAREGNSGVVCRLAAGLLLHVGLEEAVSRAERGVRGAAGQAWRCR